MPIMKTVMKIPLIVDPTLTFPGTKVVGSTFGTAFARTLLVVSCPVRTPSVSITCFIEFIGLREEGRW